MNVLEANIRNSKSKGDLRSLRINGNVPAIIYGGSNKNEKISVSKKILNEKQVYLDIICIYITVKFKKT